MKMKNLVMIGAVVIAAAVVVALKQEKKTVPEKGQGVQTNVLARQFYTLPRLIDFGAGKCMACKAMKPILADITTNCAALFTTEFVDVWENREVAQHYNVNIIPMQLFLTSEGKELFRHEGFMSKEDILAKWKELGVGGK